MIIDITKSYLRNLQEGDIIYSITDNIQYKIIEINYRFDNVILRFSEDNSYEDLDYNTVDERDYKIFREIIFE
jgi:hypothetical protein